MNQSAGRPPSGSHHAVAVVGGGQAGLSISYCLQRRGIDHVVFEKHRLGHAWRTQRWDSFCLVTPNWQCALPGFSYPGDDPNGFMKKDAIVDYIERYAASFAPPLRQDVAVTRLRQDEQGEFELQTTQGDIRADQVVVATGGYDTPVIPRMAERLPLSITQLHSAEYRNPQALPGGAVLIVGTGQSGCQIAEDLHLAGRQVHLCVGGAPRSPRRYRSKDVVDWLTEMGYYDIPIDEHPQKEQVREKTNHYVTGRDGGREIDLRRFALEGMRLYGRLQDLRGTQLSFRADLRRNLDNADDVAASIKASIDKYIDTHGIDAPTEPAYRPPWQPTEEPLAVDLAAAGITTVIWCIGYRNDFSWIELPVFDGKGYPGHRRGVTGMDGLYFLGLPWLYTWGSGRFSGVARDAEHLAAHIEAHHRQIHRARRERSVRPGLNELALGS